MEGNHVRHKEGPRPRECYHKEGAYLWMSLLATSDTALEQLSLARGTLRISLCILVALDCFAVYLDANCMRILTSFSTCLLT